MKLFPHPTRLLTLSLLTAILSLLGWQVIMKIRGDVHVAALQQAGASNVCRLSSVVPGSWEQWIGKGYFTERTIVHLRFSEELNQSLKNEAGGREFANHFSSIPAVSEIVVSNVRSTEFTSFLESGLPQLMGFEIADSKISADLIAMLSKCPRLKSVEFTNCKFESACSLEKLRHAQDLKELIIIKCELSGVNLHDLESIGSLRRLIALGNKCNLTDSMAIDLKSHSKLKELEVSSELSERGLAALMANSSLEKIVLRSHCLDAACVSKFAKLRPDLELDVWFDVESDSTESPFE